MRLGKLLFTVSVTLACYCTQAQNFLINEDFSTGSGITPPTGWTNNMMSGTSPVDAWDFDNAIGYSFPSPLSGKAALFDSYNKGIASAGGNNGLPENAALESPSVSTVGLGNLYLQFDHFLLRLANATAYAEVSTNGGSSWTVVYTSTSLMTNSQTDLVNLSGYVGNANFKIRFRWYQPNTTATTTSNGVWVVDNVKLFNRLVNDVAVTSVSVPQGGECASVTQPVRAIVTNMGTTTQTNIPVTINVTGPVNATFNDVISSLAPQASITVFTTASINTSAGGAFTFKAFTGMTVDDTRLNDTLQVTRTTSPTPANPVATNPQTVCSGPATITVSANPGDSTYWFNDSLSGTVIGKDTLFNTTLYASRSYFAQNSRLNSGKLTSYFIGPYRVNNTNSKGLFFDMTVANELVFDSFDVNVVYSGALYGIEVFYRPGTYVGNINNASGWTSLGVDTVNTTAQTNPLGTPQTVVVNQLRLLPGVYGFCFKIWYISGTGATPATWPNFGWKQSVNSYSNPDLTFSGAVNSYTYDPLSSAVVQVGANCTGDFNFYYRKLCNSPRTRVDVIVNPRPNAYLAAGNKFKGYFTQGTVSNPDIAYEKDTVMYQLFPPGGMTNSQFGTAWVITSFSFLTANGNPPASADTSSTTPGASNGTFTFRPSTAYADSTFIITIQVYNMVTGCDSTIYRYVYVAPKPHAEFSSSLACAGKQVAFSDSSTIVKGSLSYTWHFGDPANSTSSSKNPKFFYATAGTYNVKLVTISDLGHRDSITKVITVKNTPVVKFSSNNACLGDTTRFTNLTTVGGGFTITGYTWDLGNSTASIQTNPKTVYTSIGIFNVSLIAVSNGGCIDTLTKPISVFDKPVAAFTTPGLLCSTIPVSFSNSSTLANGQMGTSWWFGDGETDFAVSPSHPYTNPGTYSVKLKVYSNFGCFDSITKTVTIAETPKSMFTYSNACTRDSVNFTNTTTFGGTGSVNLTWTFGDATTQTSSGSVRHRYTNAGSYTASLKAESGTCSSTYSETVDVKVRPIASFTTSATCVNTAIQFTNTSTAGSTATSAWAFGDGGTDVAQSPTHTYTTAGSVTARLIMAENNCFDSVVVPLTIHALPVISFNTLPLSGLRQMKFNPTSTNMVDYVWDMDDGSTINQVDPVYTFTSNGPFNVKLTVTDANGCSNSDTKVVGFNVSVGKMPAGLDNFDVYPNPFKDKTNVTYTLTNGAKVEVKVFNLLGREITTLVNADLNAGTYSSEFNTSALSAKAGTYIVQIFIDGAMTSKQVIEIH